MIALCPISAKDRLSYFNASGSRQWGLATGAWLGLPREPCYKTPQRRVAVGAIASLLTCASGCKITRYGGWRGLHQHLVRWHSQVIHSPELTEHERLFFRPFWSVSGSPSPPATS